MRFEPKSERIDHSPVGALKAHTGRCFRQLLEQLQSHARQLRRQTLGILARGMLQRLQRVVRGQQSRVAGFDKRQPRAQGVSRGEPQLAPGLHHKRQVAGVAGPRQKHLQQRPTQQRTQLFRRVDSMLAQHGKHRVQWHWLRPVGRQAQQLTRVDGMNTPDRIAPRAALAVEALDDQHRTGLESLQGHRCGRNARRGGQSHHQQLVAGQTAASRLDAAQLDEVRGRNAIGGQYAPAAVGSVNRQFVTIARQARMRLVIPKGKRLDVAVEDALRQLAGRHRPQHVDPERIVGQGLGWAAKAQRAESVKTGVLQQPDGVVAATVQVIGQYRQRLAAGQQAAQEIAKQLLTRGRPEAAQALRR